jgi:hypothetical protein
LLAQVLLAGQVPQGYLGLGTEEFNTQTQ